MGRRMPNMYEVRVSGIPARARITYYYPGRRETFADCADDPEIEFTLFDRRGYAAPWLMRKIDDESVFLDVVEQLFDQMEA